MSADWGLPDRGRSMPIASAALMLVLWLWIAGCGEEPMETPEDGRETAGTATSEGNVNMAGERPRVRLETSKGDIVAELFEEQAPATVQNFLAYVRAGFYDGTVFHRVIPGFMVQGGGFTPDMEQKPTGDPIENEATNGLQNRRGTLAMARTMAPHSATAQFFINLADNEFLDHTEESPQGYGYAVFGEVVEGMDVVDEIARVETTTRAPHQDVPVEPVVMENAAVE